MEKHKKKAWIQIHVEEAAEKVAHNTKSDRQQEAKKTPTEVTVRQGAAARGSKPVERKVQEGKPGSPGPSML